MSLRDYRTKLKVALESEMVMEGPTPDEGFREEADMTTTLSELAEGSADEIDQLATSAESLEALMATIRSSNEAFSPRELALIGHSVRGYTANLGSDVAELLLPSQESIGTERYIASLEANIGEMAKKAWDWIVEQFRKLKEFIVDLYKRYTDLGEKIKRRCKNLKEQIDKKDGGERKNQQIEITAQQAKALFYKGKILADADFMGVVKEQIRSFKVDASTATKELQKMLAEIKSVNAYHIVITDETTTAWETTRRKYDAPGAPFSKAGDHFETPFMLGDVKFVYDPTDCTFSKVVGDVKPNTKISVSSLSEIKDIVNILYNGEGIEAAFSVIRELEKQISATTIEKLEFHSSLDEEKKKKLIAAIRPEVTIAVNVAKFSLMVIRHYFESIHAFLQVQEKMLAQYPNKPQA